MVSELKFPVPWGHIAAKAWGSPQGRPVVCLHGWLDNANTFNRLIPLLPKDYYYMAMDFGGHGLSSHRPMGFPYHFLDYVSEIRRVTFSCIFPEMVDKLILVESYVRSFPFHLLSLSSSLLMLSTPYFSKTTCCLFPRLLQANSHLTEESGRILLQRGATEVPGGEVWLQNSLTLEQCVSLMHKHSQYLSSAPFHVPVPRVGGALEDRYE
uniref:Serine hydrolase like 2 n=1 Tax=Chelonoidis abingdonii TaxID=106734 RepID=A0A8C0GWV7_CHEAB